jgi:hypothetical protein
MGLLFRLSIKLWFGACIFNRIRTIWINSKIIKEKSTTTENGLINFK